ncbi:MAG TPA: transposase [Anaerolineae bacterium]
MISTPYTNELKQFRQRLYQNFDNRADTLMELVDAICSNPDACSVVEYSLTPCFRRSYSTIFQAINEMEWDELMTARLVAPYLPRPRQRPYWLLATDVTPQPRPFAATLPDRSMVHRLNPIKGNKPITVGHEYSSLVLLPEAEAGVAPSWVVPLAVRRVQSQADKELVGSAQIDALLQEPDLPFAESFCVDVGDTSYSKPACLHRKRQHTRLVSIARIRSNRILYRPFVPDPTETSRPVGRPGSFGDRFALKEPDTWHEPDETVTIMEKSRRGKVYRIEIKAWHNMLMRGKNKPRRIAMERYPFTLVQVVRYDEDGNLACKRPMWLLAIGPYRHKLSAGDIYETYKQRFDHEHFFRFGKQKMLLAGFQTPDDDREEKWWQLVHLAYAQLWLARHVARCLPRPWERNLPAMKERLLSPTLVQRDFGRIIRQIGTPAQPPQPRFNGRGRRQGMKLPPRPRHKVVVKSQQAAKPP